jgi:hypothetical protein
MKLLLMKFAVSGSEYDSASSRAHAPQAGAALKSTSTGLPLDFASASAASASFFQFTSIRRASILGRQIDAPNGLAASKAFERMIL